MAGMNAWLLATILLIPPLLVPVLVAVRADANNRLVAVQVASTLAALIIALTTFATDQSSFIDVALCLIFISVPGTYLYTVFMERWL